MHRRVYLHVGGMINATIYQCLHVGGMINVTILLQAHAVLTYSNLQSCIAIGVSLTFEIYSSFSNYYLKDLSSQHLTNNRRQNENIFMVNMHADTPRPPRRQRRQPM